MVGCINGIMKKFDAKKQMHKRIWLMLIASAICLCVSLQHMRGFNREMFKWPLLDANTSSTPGHFSESILRSRFA
jgi:hypothetical protein